jgi:hypothetical protein
MIRPEPRAPSPKRDELAQNVSFLNPQYMRRGKEALQKFLELEKKGATKEELFQETGKFADPDTETGIFRGADTQPRFELSDENMRIRPGVSSYFDPQKGGTTPIAPARQFIQHDDLFGRVPGLGDVKTRLIMPEDQGSSVWAGSGGYAHREKPTNPSGYMEARARSNVRDPNALMPFSLRDLTAHELGGHGVQDYNRFSRGDDPNNSFMQNAFERLVHPRAAQYEKVLTDLKTRLQNEAGMTEEDWFNEFPEANEYLLAAGGLNKPRPWSRGKKSALPYLDRYENVAGEEEARKVSRRVNMTAQERRDDPPWLPEIMAHNPYELQMIRTGETSYAMPKNRGTLARLIQRKPLK